MTTTTEHTSSLRHSAPVCLIKQQGKEWIKNEIELITLKISKKGKDCPILEKWQTKLILAQLELEETK